MIDGADGETEAGEVQQNKSVTYDLSKLVNYPGFKREPRKATTFQRETSLPKSWSPASVTSNTDRNEPKNLKPSLEEAKVIQSHLIVHT